MIGCTAGELDLIFLDDKRQPFSQVRCWVCDQAIPEPLCQQVVDNDIGAIGMCAKPECLGYQFKFVRTHQNNFAVRMGLVP